MSKHTKGPWEVDKIASMHVQSGRRGVCSTGGYSNNQECPIKIEEENQANAHLIAAAPDMLEALEEVLNIKDYDTAEKCEEVREKARAIVAKARGE
jgi:hypothetical protein